VVKAVLQLEGAAVCLAATLAYFLAVDGGPILFAALILAPDLSMVSFLKSSRLGTVTYNLGHNYLLAGSVAGTGLLLDSSVTVSIGLILAAHIGMDRALSYGLKYPTGFKHTHMQRV